MNFHAAIVAKTKLDGHNEATLFTTAASQTRPVDPAYARGHEVMFSDQYPFMLLSQVSQLEKHEM